MLTPFKTNGAIDYQALKELVEFYLEHGATELFANCLSSEMYQLTKEERIELTKEVVRQVNGRVPVISTGTFGGQLAIQAEFIRRLFSTGVEAVIAITSQLIEPEDDDEKLLVQLMLLTELTDPVPLGIYECPVPFKRLLIPQIVHWLADTGRYIFHKDTSCQMDDIYAKLEKSQGICFGFFNSNTRTALASLIAVVDGICPISGNFYPELYAYLCNHYTDYKLSNLINELQRYLSLFDAVTRIKYPLYAKIFLQKRDLIINDFCRISQEPLTYEEGLILDSLFNTLKDLACTYKYDFYTYRMSRTSSQPQPKVTLGFGITGSFFLKFVKL